MRNLITFGEIIKMKYSFTKTNLDILKQNLRMNSNYQYYAKLIMNNKLSLHSNLEIIEFKEQIEWNYEHSISSKTYQVYIQSLSFLNPLLFLYEKTEEIEYYKKAEKEIESWLNYFENSNNEIIWAEHAVANRLITLLYFLSLSQESSNNYNSLINVIDSHLKFLANPIYYKENNHGLMMDKALLVTSIFLKDEYKRNFYIDIAKNRVEKLILRDFSYKGVHLENSPEYHILVMKLLNNIINLFHKLDVKMNYRINYILKKAESYLPYIVNNKQEIPMIGDTSLNYIKEPKSYDDFIDYEAGISVFNNKTLKSTLIFNSGFKNKVHKHRDDLSFLYSVNGENLLVDGGKFSYDSDSELVKFIRSPLAHNTFTTRNMEYSILDNDLSKINTTLITEDYKYVVGEMNLNEKKLKRHLIILDEGAIVILDQGESINEEEWIQNFLLDEVAEVDKIRENLLNIKHNNLEYQINFMDISDNIRILYGEKDNAFISKKFNEITDCYRIENIKFSKNCSFLTLINPNKNQNYQVKLENSKLLFINSNKQITIPLQ